jgi:hypothetical protein
VIVGYARVSTDAQDYKGQETALLAAGAEKVFAEKVSGAVTDRKALGRALAALGAGDVLLVTTGSAGAKHQGPPKRLVRRSQGGSGVQVPGGRVGGYHHASRQADDNDPGRLGGVRKEPNSIAYG